MTAVTATITSTNPATGERIATFEPFTTGQIHAALAQVHGAQAQWRAFGPQERSRLLVAAAAALRSAREELAALATAEMGKPLAESLAEVEKCAWACEHYAEQAQELLAPRPVAADADLSYVAYEPLGVVLAVMPWNYPFWQVLRFAAPALAAGNGVLLKHASNVSQCALAIEDLFVQAGFPWGLVRTILVADEDVAQTTEWLLGDARIAAVTLTGSARAGAAVAAAAGRALKKSVLELGGSDPFVVLADADVEAAAVLAARARFGNCGQSCIAAKRFIVEAPVADAFEAAFARAVEAMPVGDPLDPRTQVGPLARADLLDALEAQVAGSVERGARVVIGGRRLQRPGNFYAPTLLADVTRGMPVLAEETFGPVAALVRVPDADAAVAAANDTPYGLGASIWSADAERAQRLGRRIACGMVFVNRIVASDPRLPFGGIGRSGYGRELSHEGLLEFVNTRTVAVDMAPSMPSAAALAE
ncbi:aldehyde dehydrogenase family protein [Conexibacter sp. CPCC 206217]|uniref:aldehyde dehydrogenase family protein n=1 Tax=Conexibacter sp. CPCC 206217 TaxID=3064574 RepID=UPI002727C896|nr:aldehyde dehydrogenase family protein [Conexibacter sp. CPCC 206217]MDO8208918.1 aldehyde dehydrogenase family protein [Conexibacter sp. CPCC 206217]